MGISTASRMIWILTACLFVLVASLAIINRMKSRNSFVAVLIVLIGGFLCLPEAQARDDWQVWHSYQLKWEFIEDLTLRVNGEQRITDDFTDSTLANMQVGFLWKASKYFDLGPFFKYERSKNSKGVHTNENRWLIEANLKGKWGRFGLQDRNRVAYRNRNSFDSWRYRNRVKIYYEIPVKKLKFVPFASEELFYESDDAFNQNRIQFGLVTYFNKHVALATYYMIRSKRSGSDWNDDQVLGTSLGFSF